MRIREEINRDRNELGGKKKRKWRSEERRKDKGTEAMRREGKG